MARMGLRVHATSSTRARTLPRQKDLKAAPQSICCDLAELFVCCEGLPVPDTQWEEAMPKAVPAQFWPPTVCLQQDFRAELYRLDLERLESEQRLQVKVFLLFLWRLFGDSKLCFRLSSWKSWRGEGGGSLRSRRRRLLGFRASGDADFESRLPALQGGVSPELQLCSALKGAPRTSATGAWMPSIPLSPVLRPRVCVGFEVGTEWKERDMRFHEDLEPSGAFEASSPRAPFGTCCRQRLRSVQKLPLRNSSPRARSCEHCRHRSRLH